MPINAVNLTGNVYPAGPKGDTGPANTLEIGTVEKGENASASITGEAPNQTLNLILPKGDKGEKGDTGETNSLSIGTVEKGTVPSATITGQAPNQILNLVLPKGDTGEKGEVGPRGEQGIQGNPGPINSIKIGRVEKGEEASVTIVGESPNQILNFVLPIGPKGNTGEKGDQGPKGEQGIQGETGATTSLSIGLVSSGEEASATIIGEAPDQILNLVLPKGDKGEKGNVGPQGVQGIQGETGPANSLTIGTVEKGAVPSATITGEAPNQVLNLVLPTGETAEIEAIKKENNLLKSQIPEGHASGNNIHLEDSSNLDFEWKLRCRSRQETREGYNLANLDADSFTKNGVTVTNNGDGSWTFNGTSNSSGDLILTKNILLNHKIYQFEDAKYLFKTIVVSGSFSNPDKVIVQTSAMGQDNGADNFATLYNKLSDGVFVNIFNKKSTSHLSRFELYCGPNITFNNYTIKILFAKTDNKELEWEQYGVSPSLDFLSEIKNVGDNVNLAYISSKTDYNYSSTLEKDAVLINGTSRNAGNIVLYLNGDDGITLKANKKYIVSLFFDGDVTGNGYKTIYLQGMTIGDIASNKMVTKEIILSEDKVCKTINLDLSANCTFDNMKVKVMITENGKLKEYIPYNCIKATICNKNLYKVEKVINDSNTPRFTFLREGNVEFTTGAIPLIIAPTTIKEKTEYTYILKCKSNVTTENNINFTGIYEDGTSELLSANKKKDTNEFIVKFKTNKEKTLAYVTQQYTNSAGVTIITEGIMILEGDYLNLDEPYEIHQEQEIIFPLAEGQKLYEGSYLAKDGIHNKRKQVVLTGNENWYMITNISTTKTQVFCLNNIVNNISVNHVTFKSNYFVHKKWIDAIYAHLDEPYMSQTDTTNIYLNIYKSLLSSVDATGFKSWLKSLYDAGKPVEIEYPLATEEIIPYTPEQQAVIDKILYTYKNVTNISVDNELATLDITYKKDIETMFNNQSKEYNERLSNIENLLNTTETSALLLDNLENDLKEEV